MTDRQIMSCTDVDSVLLDYLEETLDVGARKSVDEHVAGCLRCNSLLRDINSISADASRLPELAPSRDLWAGIAERIEPTVVPLTRTPPLTRRSWIPAAAAAAALVIATAGITYVATSRSLRPAEQRVAVATPRLAPVVAEPAVTSGDSTAEASPEAPATVAAGAVSSHAAGSRVAARESKPQNNSSRASLASRVTGARLSAPDIAYGDEIARLQNIITERRKELDPSTVSVIEQSLKIIDAAVLQSRAALARDPKSGFLADQLNHALDKKVELLRTVALLPSRT